MEKATKTSVKQTESPVLKNEPSKPNPTKFTLKSIALDFAEMIYNMIFDPVSLLGITFFFVVLESLALKVIVYKIPYTEIDYQAYMEQLDMIFNDGVTDYSKIEGGTGPLVYPAGHVHLFRVLRFFTNGMEHISEGQVIFRWLYLLTMVVDYSIYAMIGNIPPFCAVFFCLSKRLHSIYVLRLFNDCFTTFFVSISCLLLIFCGKFYKYFQDNDMDGAVFVLNLIAVAVYSFSISIKMNALLYLPAVLVILVWFNYNTRWFLLKMLLYIAVGCQLQVSIASRFLATDSAEYWANAFDFKRKFMYKWTINWQFISEDFFLSDEFSKILLLVHFAVLLIFVITKWIKPVLTFNKVSLTKFVLKLVTLDSQLIFPSLNASHIAYMLVSANYIGVVFSRSLHYQFLSWYHWNLPILFVFAFDSTNSSKNSTLDTITIKEIFANVRFLILSGIWFVLHELCWNVYPPNGKSSLLLFALNLLMLLLTFKNYNADQILIDEQESAETVTKPKQE